jgi:hypothetical protein
MAVVHCGRPDPDRAPEEEDELPSGDQVANGLSQCALPGRGAQRERHGCTARARRLQWLLWIARPRRKVRRGGRLEECGGTEGSHAAVLRLGAALPPRHVWAAADRYLPICAVLRRSGRSSSGRGRRGGARVGSGVHFGASTVTPTTSVPDSATPGPVRQQDWTPTRAAFCTFATTHISQRLGHCGPPRHHQPQRRRRPPP